MLDSLTVDLFAPHVGDVFQLHASPTDRLPITLIAAERLNSAGAPGAKRHPFSLLFRPPPGVIPRQQIYRVEHERLGAWDIFLVPVTPDAEGPRLEAIFN